jgi:hypothetical protein
MASKALSGQSSIVYFHPNLLYVNMIQISVIDSYCVRYIVGLSPKHNGRTITPENTAPRPRVTQRHCQTTYPS